MPIPPVNVDVDKKVNELFPMALLEDTELSGRIRKATDDIKQLEEERQRREEWKKRIEERKRRRLAAGTDKEPETTLSSLAPDLMMNILSRIPVKFVLRSKCVCKDWFNLIKAPIFTKLQLSKSIQYKINEKLVFNVSGTLFFAEHETSSGTAKDIRTRVGPGFPITCLEVVGSCRGLLCVRTSGKVLLLWNPCTREFKKVPGARVRSSSQHSAPLYGFGYDPISDDFKVARLVTFASHETVVKVYSLKANSWKRIEDFPYRIAKRINGVFVETSLHWIVTLNDDQASVPFVAYLNLSNKAYGVFNLPEKVKSNAFEFGVLGGCLCAYGNPDDLHFEVWPMKEYGLVESWTRVSIYTRFITGCNELVHLKPLCLLYTGIVFKMGKNGVLVYYPRQVAYRYMVLRGLPYYEFDAVAYIESLISPVAVNNGP